MNQRISQFDGFMAGQEKNAVGCFSRLAEHPPCQVSRHVPGGAGAPPSKKKAFTLIELLVVIAIISLLVSILLPSLQKAKSLARQVICQTRLKAIGSSLFIYMNDFNDRGPVGFTNGSDSRPYGWSGWPNETPVKDSSENPYRQYYGWYSGRTTDKSGNPCWALGEYVGVNKDRKSKIAVACPNSEHIVLEGEITDGTTYAVNYYLGYDTYLCDHVVNMASTPMLMDGVYPISAGSDRMQYMMFPRPWGGIIGQSLELIFVSQATYSHDRSGNFLFFDGHTENQPGLDIPLDYTDIYTFYGE